VSIVPTFLSAVFQICAQILSKILGIVPSFLSTVFTDVCSDLNGIVSYR